jgi:hypothetical protein
MVSTARKGRSQATSRLETDRVRPRKREVTRVTSQTAGRRQPSSDSTAALRRQNGSPCSHQVDDGLTSSAQRAIPAPSMTR